MKKRVLHRSPSDIEYDFVAEEEEEEQEEVECATREDRDKKLTRRERNRQSARRSRARKRKRLEDLEALVEELTHQNELLKQENAQLRHVVAASKLYLFPELDI